MRLRTFALVGAVAIVPSLADAQTAPVGASKLLTVSPQAFLDTCRADIEQARASAAQFRTATGDDWAAALDRYDAAFSLLGNAASRAGLAREVHPDEAMRKAAAQCESDVDKAATELSLDRPTYEALARLNCRAPTRRRSTTSRRRCATSGAPASTRTTPRAPA